MADSPSPPRLRRAWPYLGLALISLPLFFYGLADYSIVDGDEAQYHYVARQMVKSGDWTHLEFTGEHRVYDTFMNAPLHYWARAALISIFGDNRWTMRILSAVAALAAVLATCWLATRLFDPLAGFLAGLALLANFQFVYLHSARSGELEPMVCLVLVLAAGLLMKATREGSSFVPHHLCLACLVTLKLPLLIPTLCAEVAYMALTPVSRRLLLRYLLTGLVVIPVGLLWHAWNALYLGLDAVDVLGSMMTDATRTRGTIGSWVFHHVAGYARIFVYGSWPLVLVYPLGVIGLLWSARPLPNRSDFTLAAFYSLSIALFFVFVSKFNGWYIIPVYPFLSVFVGVWLARAWRRNSDRWLPVATGLILTLVALVRTMPLNPFSHRLNQILFRAPEILLTMKEPASLTPPLTLLLGTALVVVALLAVRHLLPAFGQRVTLALLCLVLVSFAGRRVSEPLGGTDFLSEMEAKRRELDRRLRAGEDPRYPIPIFESGNLRVRYFFGEDHDIYLVRHRGPRDGAPTFIVAGPGQTTERPRPFR